jgi:hypothetical protein
MSQALQFDKRHACAEFLTSRRDEMDVADASQGHFEVTYITEGRHRAGRHHPPVRFGLWTRHLMLGCAQNSTGTELRRMTCSSYRFSAAPAFSVFAKLARRNLPKIDSTHPVHTPL